MTEDDFLTAITAAPDDDTPRLVYADWLDEHGRRARAALIRVQCEQARLPEPCQLTFTPIGMVLGSVEAEVATCKACRDTHGFVCEWHRLDLLARDLIDAHAHVWLFEVPPGFRRFLPDDTRKAFRRGFIERVSCTWLDCRDYLDAALARSPVQEVTLTTVPEGEYVDEAGGGVVRFPGYPRSVPVRTLEDARMELRSEWLFLTDFALAARLLWPRIKFTGPPEENTAYQAGQRAAEDQNRRILDAILDPDTTAPPPEAP